MLYGSFAVCSGCTYSWFVLLFAWVSLFLPNILSKDYNSLMKKQGWEEYSQKSFIFLPRFCKPIILNLMVYILALGLFWMKYQGITFQDLRSLKTDL